MWKICYHNADREVVLGDETSIASMVRFELISARDPGRPITQTRKCERRQVKYPAVHSRIQKLSLFQLYRSPFNTHWIRRKLYYSNKYPTLHSTQLISNFFLNFITEKWLFNALHERCYMFDLRTKSFMHLLYVAAKQIVLIPERNVFCPLLKGIWIGARKMKILPSYDLKYGVEPLNSFKDPKLWPFACKGLSYRQ